MIGLSLVSLPLAIRNLPRALVGTQLVSKICSNISGKVIQAKRSSYSNSGSRHSGTELIPTSCESSTAGEIVVDSSQKYMRFRLVTALFYHSKLIIFPIFFELLYWAFRLVKERSGAGNMVYCKS